MITPKKFQQPYIENILSLFRVTRDHYKEGLSPADERRAFSHNGAVLLKAPTGSGKTVMAGTVAEQFAVEEDVVWLWFAPFAGLVGQAAMSLRDHHPGLRVRNLVSDRQVNQTRPGDTFILTWASVVSTSKENRKARVDSERFPSLDHFIDDLRKKGLRIGIIIDEAHHGIGAKTKSVEFYRDVLKPDYSLMITATPDDTDAEKFCKAANIKELHRITVSREETVAAGLIKPTVRSIAYISPPDQAALADFEAAALNDAVNLHEQIKQELSAQKIQLTPLLMIQVSSEKDSVEETKARLIKLGFKESAISVHTAKEPDANFLAMAVDETKEVLIFKMAAALGFDAPRAFAMVSMRPIRDTDFGTQLVGRIMRVHRKLQGKKLPPILENGYLFLADSDSQAGIASAADKINQLKSQFSQSSPFTMITRIGGVGTGTQVQVVSNGQPDLIPSGDDDEDTKELPAVPAPNQTPDDPSQGMLELLNEVAQKARDGQETEPAAEGGSPTSVHRYELKKGSPMRFFTQELPLEIDDLLDCIEQQVSLDDKKLLTALSKDVEIFRVEREHFGGKVEESSSRVVTQIDLEKAGREAQSLLLRQRYLDPRELQDRLLQRLEKEFRRNGLGYVADDEDQLLAALDLILARHPAILSTVEKECAARYATIKPSGILPAAVSSETALSPSFKNIYGVFPSDLNSWELDFAKLLDNDPSGTVLWWHRNPPRKKSSVAIVRPDGGRFFPDFIVGVKDRTVAKDGILLIETKGAIGSLDSQIKAVVEHKEYGKALMLHWRNREEWMTVRYDPKSDKNKLDAIFRPEAMPTY